SHSRRNRAGLDRPPDNMQLKEPPMLKITQAFAVAAVTLLVLNVAPDLAAASTKVWVSNDGVDSASCGAITSPCATFQRAHNNVAAGGEIGVLTPGDYGVVSITKSASIINDGSGDAAIQPLSTDGVTVDSAGAVVQLRGLTIDGAAATVGGGGIFFLMGSS